MTRAEIIESLNCLKHYADTQVCAENDKLELEAAEAYKDMRERIEALMERVKGE